MKIYAILFSLGALMLFKAVNAEYTWSGTNKGNAIVDTLVKGLGEATPLTYDNCQIKMGDRFKIAVSDDGKERQFPFIFKCGPDIFLSYSEHHDSEIASPVDPMAISRDNGKSWKEIIRNKDFSFTSIFEKGGILYGIVYFTYPISGTKERMIFWTSSDRGKTWSRHDGIVHAPEGDQFKLSESPWGSMVFHRGMQVMADGSVQGLMYGNYAKDTNYRVIWVKSTDNCASWQIVSTIASGVPDGKYKNPEGYCEPTFAQLKDGSLLCVMRMGSPLPMFQSRSYDNGLTWSSPVTLPGLTREESESVDPQLILMKNGILALTFGRPGDKIAFSTDGRGEKWDCYVNTYQGETTGYTSIVETKPGELLLVADQGRTGAREMAVWGMFIQAGPNTK